ncbi:hypothetical protein AVEN_39410-1 [Araneus ventricosus]|uniref:Uncharacterized protein n=1 Tax=Araneus ventricosus TaxID=182803 RepID=A0A4Y2M9K0_ARAVE|nr:hypothetical protein AVEN_39410-1 [Araneus ventricosus]
MQKYKNLWKSNLEETEYFKQCIESLEERLEDAHHRIVMAERLCMNNAALVHDLEQKIQEEIILFRDQEDGGAENTFKHIYWGVSGQLMAALNENKYIRQFLQRNVLPKEKDFLKLRSSLETKADEYRKEIVEATPKPPEPEPVVEEKPDPKAKGKKKGKKIK